MVEGERGWWRGRGDGGRGEEIQGTLSNPITLRNPLLKSSSGVNLSFIVA